MASPASRRCIQLNNYELYPNGKHEIVNSATGVLEYSPMTPMALEFEEMREAELDPQMALVVMKAVVESSLDFEQYDKVLEFTDPSKLIPADIELLRFRGIACLHLGKLQEAEELFKSCLQIDETCFKARFELAQLYLLKAKACLDHGQIPESLAHINQALVEIKYTNETTEKFCQIKLPHMISLQEEVEKVLCRAVEKGGIKA